MKIYVAGPMTGIPEHNYPAFGAAARDLRALGHEVVSPHEGADEPESKSWAEWMRRDIRLLLDCEAVATLKGYENSKGAALEAGIAKALGMAVVPVADLLRVLEAV